MILFSDTESIEHLSVHYEPRLHRFTAVLKEQQHVGLTTAAS